MTKGTNSPTKTTQTPPADRLDQIRAALEPPSAPLTRKLDKSEGNTNTVVMTDAGLEYFGVLASIGANIPLIADRFCKSERWLRALLRNDKQVETIWKQNRAKDRLEVLAARTMLEATNAQVHIWSSKQKLGESERAEQDVNHRVHVVGMVPNPKTYTTEEWLKEFSPYEQSGSQDKG